MLGYILGHPRIYENWSLRVYSQLLCLRGGFWLRLGCAVFFTFCVPAWQSQSSTLQGLPERRRAHLNAVRPVGPISSFRPDFHLQLTGGWLLHTGYESSSFLSCSLLLS